MLSLSTMLQLELPHVNVLTKIDLLKRYGELKFNLDYYTEVQVWRGSRGRKKEERKY
jgi:GPN-loop GTPase